MIDHIIQGVHFFLGAFMILMVISGLGALVRYFLRWLDGDGS